MKSRVVELQREIDQLTRQAFRTGEKEHVARATRLARQKEDLLKPAAMRSANADA